MSSLDETSKKYLNVKQVAASPVKDQIKAKVSAPSMSNTATPRPVTTKTPVKQSTPTQKQQQPASSKNTIAASPTRQAAYPQHQLVNPVPNLKTPYQGSLGGGPRKVIEVKQVTIQPLPSHSKPSKVVRTPHIPEPIVSKAAKNEIENQNIVLKHSRVDLSRREVHKRRISVDGNTTLPQTSDKPVTTLKRVPSSVVDIKRPAKPKSQPAVKIRPIVTQRDKREEKIVKSMIPAIVRKPKEPVKNVFVEVDKTVLPTRTEIPDLATTDKIEHEIMVARAIELYKETEEFKRDHVVASIEKKDLEDSTILKEVESFLTDMIDKIVANDPTSNTNHDVVPDVLEADISVDLGEMTVDHVHLSNDLLNDIAQSTVDDTPSPSPMGTPRKMRKTFTSNDTLVDLDRKESKLIRTTLVFKDINGKASHFVVELVPCVVNEHDAIMTAIKTQKFDHLVLHETLI